MGEGTLEVGKRAGWMGQTGGALVPVRLGGGAGKKVWRERVPREAADVGRTTWAGPPGLVVHGGEQARGRVGPVGTRGPVRPPQPRLPAPQGRQLESVKAEAAEHPETHAAPARSHGRRGLRQVPRHRRARRQRCEWARRPPRAPDPGPLPWGPGDTAGRWRQRGFWRPGRFSPACGEGQGGLPLPFHTCSVPTT